MSYAKCVFDVTVRCRLLERRYRIRDNHGKTLPQMSWSAVPPVGRSPRGHRFWNARKFARIRSSSISSRIAGSPEPAHARALLPLSSKGASQVPAKVRASSIIRRSFLAVSRNGAVAAARRSASRRARPRLRAARNSGYRSAHRERVQFVQPSPAAISGCVAPRSAIFAASGQ
jgi:hypothetical protein